MFSKALGLNSRYETEEEKKKIEEISNRLLIRKRGPLFDVLTVAVANIKNENDVEAVIRRIMKERPELQKQNEFENLERYMFEIYYDIKVNPQIDTISANENNSFASIEKDKLNRIFTDYLGKISFHMTKKNITSISTNNLEEIFGEDSSNVQYVIDSSPFMTKDSENNYRFISDYVEHSIMAKYSFSNVDDIDLSGIPDFDDDDSLDSKEDLPRRGLG